MMRYSIQWFCIEVATYLKWIISSAPWHYPNLFNIWRLHPLPCHTVHHLHFDGGRPSSHQPLLEPILSLCLKMSSICQFINRTNESIDLHLSTSYFVSIALRHWALRYEVFPGGEEYSRKALSLWPYNCFGGQPSTLSLSHCWQTGTSTWQSCWVGLRPSGINLPRYPCAIHLRFDNGHEERLIYAAASLWKASRGWTWRTLFTLSCLLGLRPTLWCKPFYFLI